MLKSSISGERLCEEGKPPTLQQNGALKQVQVQSNLPNKTKPASVSVSALHQKLPNSPCDASWLPHSLCFSSRKAVGALRLLAPRSLMVWWSSELCAPLRRGQRPHLLAMPTSGAPATAASRPSRSRQTSSLLAGGGTRRSTGVRYWFKWKEFARLISAVSPVWHGLAFHRLHLFNGGGRVLRFFLFFF